MQSLKITRYTVFSSGLESRLGKCGYINFTKEMLDGLESDTDEEDG